MNNIDFDKIVDDCCIAIKSTLTNKAKEYATEEDRLHNFKEGARRLVVSPEEVLKGFLLKHETSLDDILNSIKKYNYVTIPHTDSSNLTDKALIDEKIGDIINYYILLKALLYERLKW